MKKIAFLLVTLLSINSLKADDLTVIIEHPHKILPFFSYKEIKHTGKFKNKIFHAGLGYRYVKEKGYNANLSMTLGSAATYDYNAEIEFDNLFIFKTNYNFDIFPFVNLKTEMYGIPSHFEEKERSIQHMALHGGIGISKRIGQNLTFSYHLGLSQDLMKRMMARLYDKTYRGYDLKKLAGIKNKLILNYELSPAHALEFEPYYHKYFDSKEIEKGAKFSFVWAI